MRWYTGVGCFVVVVLLLGCLGLGVPADLLIALVAGWAFYLYRVIPQLHVSGMGVATALVCLVGFVPGLHRFLNWMMRDWGKSGNPEDAMGSPPQPPWRASWTAAAVGITLLMFMTGIAAAGLLHQVGWLITSTSPFFDNESSVLRGRLQSTNNLKQMGMGLYSIREQEKRLPPGCTVDPHGEILQSWMAFVLPYLEHQDLFDKIDPDRPWNHPDNEAVFKARISAFTHPGYSDRPQYDQDGFALTHYTANVHVMGGRRRLTETEIKDGTGSTILAGEIADRFPAWGRPGNWRDPALGVNRRPDGFGGPSPGGANFLFVDGSVRFLKNTIDLPVLQALGTPDGGEQISSDQY